MPFHSGYHKIQCGQTKLDAAAMCQKMILQVIGFRTELDRTVLDVLDRHRMSIQNIKDCPVAMALIVKTPRRFYQGLQGWFLHASKGRRRQLAAAGVGWPLVD